MHFFEPYNDVPTRHHSSVGETLGYGGEDRGFDRVVKKNELNNFEEHSFHEV